MESRLVLYSVSGNAWAAPQLITISFMPDGTNINGKTSNLQSKFNTKFGSASAWQNIFIKAAQTWAAKTNINFVVVPDNGVPEGSGSNQQGDPGFGDIRIGGYSFGTTTLAQAFMPPPVNNYSVAGDILFNTGQTFNNGTTYDLFTVATHEFGHALGLYHSGIASAAEYSSYNGVKNALTSDDIAGIQSIYSGGQPRSSDAYFNTTNSTPNFATAYDITANIVPTALTAQIGDGTISVSGGSDLFSFTVPPNPGTTMSVSVQSNGLSLLTPGFVVYDGSQQQIASAQGVATGDTITTTWSSLTAGSTFYIKVFSPVATVFGTGDYALTLNLGNGATPAVPLPNTTMANGSPLSSGGGMAVKLNQETLVNTFTNGQQTTSAGRNAVAMDAEGNYVAVWASQNEDGNDWGVYAQRYDTAGAKLGTEFRVNTTTNGDQTNAAVAMDTSGNFVVTWQCQDGSGWGVYAQRYNASGVAVGGEFRVNTTTTEDQSNPTLTMNTTGFVIAWQSQSQDGSDWGVYAQRYNASGVAVGGEFRVNTHTQQDQTNPSMAMDSLGAFVVAWQSKDQDGQGWDVYAQRYSPSSLPVGGEFRVNTTTLNDQTSPSVAMDLTGDFAVAWQSQFQDGNGWGIYTQRYNDSGAKVGGETLVNTTTSGDQLNPSAAMDNAGDLLITWSSNVGPSWTISGQQYTAAGVPLGGEFVVNTTQGYTVSSPSVVMNNQGNVVSAWTGGSPADSADVFTQQFTISFSQEVSDGFYAQGDPNDPHHEDPPAVTCDWEINEVRLFGRTDRMRRELRLKQQAGGPQPKHGSAQGGGWVANHFPVYGRPQGGREGAVAFQVGNRHPQGVTVRALRHPARG